MSTVPHSALLVPITQVELAMIERLKLGLGKMVTEVVPYRGELDKMQSVLPRLPAAWISFGAAKFDKHGNGWRWLTEFVVMVGARNPRSKLAARHGGPVRGEVGANMLTWSVVRLLANQKLGLAITPMQPVRCETLFNAADGDVDLAVYAVHFSTAWQETWLDDGAWPDPEPQSASNLFAEYAGATDQTPALASIQAQYSMPPGTDVVAQDLILTRES